MQAYQIFAEDFGRSVAIYAMLIAGFSVIEAIIPFYRRRGGLRRTWANLTLLGLYFMLNFVLSVGALGVSAWIAARGWGVLAVWQSPFALKVVAAVVGLDFFSYVAHRIMHKVPLLWRVHRVHHSDVHVDVTTAFRQHPLEGLWRFAFTMIPAWALGAPLEAVVIYRLISGLNALLEHANLRLWQPLDGALSLFFVTPNMHKVHHSRRQFETDSNYGNILSLFDRLFRTFTPSSRSVALDYGLDDFDDPGGAGNLLSSPFRGTTAGAAESHVSEMIAVAKKSREPFATARQCDAPIAVRDRDHMLSVVRLGGTVPEVHRRAACQPE